MVGVVLGYTVNAKKNGMIERSMRISPTDAIHLVRSSSKVAFRNPRLALANYPLYFNSLVLRYSSSTAPTVSGMDSSSRVLSSVLRVLGAS
jgi:hypothetical protein